MQFRSRGQIHVDVIHARNWFEEINISTTGTRLELIQGYFDELLNPTLPEGANPLGVDATEEDTYYALSDGAGFGLIKAEMSKLPPHRLRGKMRNTNICSTTRTGNQSTMKRSGLTMGASNLPTEPQIYSNTPRYPRRPLPCRQSGGRGRQNIRRRGSSR